MPHVILLRRVVRPIFAACLLAGFSTPTFADRHCSYARESAFYAKELSAEAKTSSAATCPAQTAEALDRLRNAMEELEICSCSYAEEPLRRWLENAPANGAGPAATCTESAAAINRIARQVLTQVEKCF